MNRESSHWLLAGSILASGLIGMVLSIASLGGFPNGAAGDTPVSLGNGLAMTTLLAGAAAMLGLELRHVSRRRPADATAVVVAGQHSPAATSRTRAAP